MPHPPPLFRPIQHQENLENWQTDFTQMPKSRGNKLFIGKGRHILWMGRDFSHMDRKGVTKNLIKKIIPSLKLHHYIQNDIEPLLDLGVILEKLFGFSRSRLKFWNRYYEVSVFVCSYVPICVIDV